MGQDDPVDLLWHLDCALVISSKASINLELREQSSTEQWKPGLVQPAKEKEATEGLVRRRTISR